MFPIKYWAALALGVAVTTASPTPNTIRSSSSESSTSLYAYGSSTRGLPLWYGNGMAYLGHYHPDNITNSANVTLSMSDSSLTAQATNNSADPSIGSSKLYIDTTSGSFAQVGFTNDSTAASGSTTTTGFSFLGTMLMWENDDGDLESSWYAEPLNEEGSVWKLLWNTDVDIASDTTVVPIVLKNTAPTSK